MKTNYHTHTTRCKHAQGSDEDYVLSAIKGGYTELGFSDHTPWKYNNPNFVSNIRMELKDFADYRDSILKLKEKYKDQISIKLGIEAEYYPKYKDWMMNFVKENKLDYVIFGNHFYRSDEEGPYYGYECSDDEIFRKYAQDCIDGLKTGLYAYLAHPDLFMRGRLTFGELDEELSYQICEVCKAMDIPMEYNLAGAEVSEITHRTQYPHPEFWKIAAKVGNKVIIGCDAHNNRQLENDYYRDDALKVIHKLGLELVDTITFFKYGSK